jgi:hypothetical protein
MRTADSINGYAAIRSGQVRDAVTAEEYVSWAQDALEAGYESAAIMKLAVADPPFFTPDLARLFEQAAVELEIEQISAEQALILHAQQVAIQLLLNQCDPRTAASRISTILPPDLAPAGFAHWHQLDEAYGCVYCAVSAVGSRASLEAAIIEDAQVLAAHEWRTA